MTGQLRTLADWLAAGAGNEVATAALRGIPGLPPVLQTVHLLTAAVLMGSVVLFLMRVNRLVLRSLSTSEVGRTLLPWGVGAMLVQPLSMLPFILARPHRYLLNPVFGIKMALLVSALVATAIVVRRIHQGLGEPGWVIRIIAAVALLIWFAVVLAGRWIAYADYLFWPA